MTQFEQLSGNTMALGEVTPQHVFRSSSNLQLMLLPHAILHDLAWCRQQLSVPA